MCIVDCLEEAVCTPEKNLRNGVLRDFLLAPDQSIRELLDVAEIGSMG